MEVIRVTSRWYVRVEPLDEEENPLGREHYNWGPFSTEEDASTAQRILAETDLGYDLRSRVRSE